MGKWRVRRGQRGDRREEEGGRGGEGGGEGEGRKKEERSREGEKTRERGRQAGVAEKSPLTCPNQRSPATPCPKTTPKAPLWIWQARLAGGTPPWAQGVPSLLDKAGYTTAPWTPARSRGHMGRLRGRGGREALPRLGLSPPLPTPAPVSLAQSQLSARWLDRRIRECSQMCAA